MFVGKALVHEVTFVRPPYRETIESSRYAAGRVLRVIAVDAIGNKVEERCIVGGEPHLLGASRPP